MNAVIARVQFHRRHGIQSGATRGREGVNRDSRCGIRIASFVGPSPWRKVEQKAGAGERNPTRSSSVLVKKLVAGRDVPYLLCRCRVAINWAEFTAVEKRHTANIIHRTRPVIWCRFARENRILSRTRCDITDSSKISWKGV